MREILFRGQTRRYGEKVRMGDGMKLPSRWVYGGVLQGIGDFSIIYGGENMDDPSEGLEKFCVYTDTLGQYTGLCDKNGKKIFEGDVIDFLWPGMGNQRFKIRWDETCAMFFAIPVKKHKDIWPRGFFGYEKQMAVIGNIHDNPELLEG